MVNDNREDFMMAAVNAAKDWRTRAYEACVETFTKKCVTEAMTIKMPKDANFDDQERIKKNAAHEIATINKKMVNNAIADDTNQLYNVELAHDIQDPDDISKSIQKLLAEHIYNEAEDRCTTLAAKFDAGMVNNLTATEAVDMINASFESVNFDSRYGHSESLKKKLELILSSEGAELIESIKADVNKLVTETEAKNSVIREAVSAINDKKANIEKEINGVADPVTGGTSDEKKVNNRDAFGGKNEDDPQDMQEAEQDMNQAEQNMEGWYQKAKKHNEKHVYSKEDFYLMMDYSGNMDTSTEALSSTFDDNVMSKEEAENIMKQFRQVDDGIDIDSVDANENTLSVGENEQETPAGETTPNTDSAEKEYVDDDNNVVTFDAEKFDYTDEITPDPLSEESMAKDFLPLSPNKFWNRSVKPNINKFAAYLALTKDNGKIFFDSIRNRGTEMMGLCSREDTICDTISNDEINKKVDETLGICSDIETKTKDLLEKMGITGILADNYQRTDNPIQNAVNSLFNPTIIGTDDKAHLSKEELHEHELAEIFKLCLKVADIRTDIANDVIVNGSTDQLGYLEELLNEKMFEIKDPVEKAEVENRVKALQSIECRVPVQEVVNLKVFLSSENPDADPSNKIVLDTLKDVEAYGISYVHLVEEIKADMHKKFDDELKGKYKGFNINIDQLVDFMLDMKDTSKVDASIYERILGKLSENVDSYANGTEAMIVGNKARAITTAVVAFDKLGFLSEEEFFRFRSSLM